MTRLEFMRIHSFLHLVDNERANQDDKLYKVRPLLTMLTREFQRYYVLNKEITIDEKMIKYTGRISFLQYVRNKPVKLGFKVFILSDAISAYVYNWRFYTGKENNARTFNLSQQIVMNPIQGLENRNHHIYFDSYYSSIPITRELAIKGFGCVGTINKSRRLIPPAIKDPQRLQEGETVFRKLGNTVLLVYKDKKVARFITSIHGRQLSQSGRPQIVEDYNRFMRGVDKGNQHSSYYHPNHKSMKWWKAIFSSILQVCINNAYIIFKENHPFRSPAPLKFREELVLELIENYVRERHQQQFNTLVRSRIIPGLHQIGMRQQRNCFICSTREERVTTRYYCIECDRNICVSPCFYILHTKLNLNSRKKELNIA